MLHILHGDNTVASRQQLTHLTGAAAPKAEVVHLAGKSLSLSDLIQNLEANSLFNQEKVVIIENLHAHKSKVSLNEMVEYLSKLPSSSPSLILWSAKTLTPSQLKKLANFTPRVFKTSPVVFKFLSSVIPENHQAMVTLLRQAASTDTAEMVFYMLAKHVRNLFLSQDPGAPLPPWQKAQLLSQSKKLGESKLLQLHDVLVDLDLKSKTGLLVGSLGANLEEQLVKLI